MDPTKASLGAAVLDDPTPQACHKRKQFSNCMFADEAAASCLHFGKACPTRQVDPSGEYPAGMATFGRLVLAHATKQPRLAQGPQDLTMHALACCDSRVGSA